MSDLDKWAESTPQELESIAVDIWAKKFTCKQLRGFQAEYTWRIAELSKKPASSRNLIDTLGFQNMLAVATRAFYFRKFKN